MTDTSLPKKFAHLEKYVEEWSIREATQVSLNSEHIKYLHYPEQETSLRHHYYYMKQFTK